jgi:hypothetical protein
MKSSIVRVGGIVDGCIETDDGEMIYDSLLEVGREVFSIIAQISWYIKYGVWR